VYSQQYAVCAAGWLLGADNGQRNNLIAQEDKQDRYVGKNIQI
jgi:hypothetical protein